MVMNLGNNVTLEGLENTTKLPFVIASQLTNEKEQFLCPVVGELEPVLQSVMCEPFGLSLGHFLELSRLSYLI